MESAPPHNSAAPHAAPAVSFVLPAWKGARLARAIESILAQTERDFELIVADDCSPDDIAGVVSRFPDPRVSYFRNAANIGGRDLAAAWNAAFARARGEFAVLAADDDAYSPRFLAEMLRLARENPLASLFHCRVRFVDCAGRETGLSEVRPAWESPVAFAYARGALRMKQCASDFMFRTSALRRAGGFASFPRGWFSDDATWMALAANGGVACSPEPLCEHCDGANISSLFSDAPEKIEAAESFRAWAARFLATLEPRDGRERELLRRAMREIPRAADRISFWVLRNAPARAAWRAFRERGGILRTAAFAARMARAAAASAAGAAARLLHARKGR